MDQPPLNAAPEESEDEERWPVWAEGVLESLRGIPTIRSAALRAGVDRRTIQRLVNRDERFALAVHDAREEALDTIEETIVLRARSGQPIKRVTTKTDKDGNVERTEVEESHLSDILAMFYLKRWRPEYRESYRVEQTGPGGGPIQIDLDARIADAIGLFDAEVVRLSTDRDEGTTPSASRD